ncbi:hypothetical protein ACROYT_G020162 [Oculina patagonica]
MVLQERYPGTRRRGNRMLRPYAPTGGKTYNDDDNDVDGDDDYDDSGNGAYSRHLCVSTRSTNVMESRPSTSSSDSEDKTFLGQAGHGPYDDFKRRNLTLSRQVSIAGKVPQQVYNMDHKFHKKFGTKSEMIETHAITPTPHQARRRSSPTNSVYSGIDDDASSLCADSVSSIACSSITHVDKQEKWNRDVRKLSDKYAKFDDIEKWLQSLPKPGLGKLSKM